MQVGHIKNNKGLWALKTWKSSVSLNQLALSDAKEIKYCYLYELSHKDVIKLLLQGLELFQNVVFVSSHQDSYAPFESARAQLIGKIEESDL